MFDRVAVRVVTACALLVLTTSGLLALAPQEHDTYALALECRSAIWKAAFDEATAAGLNPRAIVVDVAAGKMTRRDEATEIVMTGVDAYQPTTDVAPFPVRHECRLDRATGTVRSVRYVAIDGQGQAIAKAPSQMVKDGRYLSACIERLERDLADEVRRRGVSAPVAAVEVGLGDVNVRMTGGNADVSGRGRGRYGEGFEWRILNFSCSYDVKRQRVARLTHALESPLPALALPRESLDAIDACREAVGSQVVADAQQRGYPRLDGVEVELPELADVTPRGGYLDVTGRGQFRLDVRHRQPTPLTFACAWDPRSRRVVSARFEVAPGAWTPSGEIADGRTESLRCGSPRFPRQECPAAIRGNVRVIREFGTARCEAYRNWMWSNSQIVVWDGCAAEFEYDAR